MVLLQLLLQRAVAQLLLLLVVELVLAGAHLTLALAYAKVARAAAAHRYDETRATLISELVHRPNARGDVDGDGGGDEGEDAPSRPVPGGATADDIDAAMKVGCGYPMGPFELLDVVGLDVSLAIERELYTEFREPGFAPAPLLEHLVTAGYLGRKTGRGFRDYAGR